jgi:hypothetical protein
LINEAIFIYRRKYFFEEIETWNARWRKIILTVTVRMSLAAESSNAASACIITDRMTSFQHAFSVLRRSVHTIVRSVFL